MLIIWGGCECGVQIIKQEVENGQRSLLLEHHPFYGASVDLHLGPLDRKRRRLEELFVGILSAHVLARKVALRELLYQHIVALY
jgi:hypothetical protein